jgi:hypothetical protein
MFFVMKVYIEWADWILEILEKGNNEAGKVECINVVGKYTSKTTSRLQKSNRGTRRDGG